MKKLNLLIVMILVLLLPGCGKRKSQTSREEASLGLSDEQCSLSEAWAACMKCVLRMKDNIIYGEFVVVPQTGEPALMEYTTRAYEQWRQRQQEHRNDVLKQRC